MNSNARSGRTTFILASALAMGMCAVGTAEEKAAKPQMVTVKVRADKEHHLYRVAKAMDGDPNTFWHTDHGFVHSRPPHEIIVDLGQPFEISGFSYLPRSGRGDDDGTIKDYECYAGDSDKDWGKPVVAGTMPEKVSLNVIRFPAKVRGRYFRLRALSDVSGKGWISIAELRILSEGYEFRAADSIVAGVRPRTATDPADPMMEWEDQYKALQDGLRRRTEFAKLAPQTFREGALILPADRDSLDIVLRRTAALAADLKQMPKAPDLAEADTRLAKLQDAARSTAVGDVEARFNLFVEACKLRRQIALANPLLNFDRILFIKRHRPGFDHMCGQYYGATARPGGGLYVLSEPFGASPKLRDVLENSVVQSGRLKGEKLAGGCFVSPSLSYDGKTVLFAYVECRGDAKHILHVDPARGHWDPGRCYHIFKVNADGTDLVQLTDGTWNEFSPCWLPNGRIAFISERRGGYMRCGLEFPTFTLYDMAADGGDIRPLSVHETSEWHPSVTHEGRIIYTRWDYVDRGAMVAHLPWITTLDGRDSRAVHGNFSRREDRPEMELDVRAIPGSQRYVATAAPHHGQAFGSLVVIDPQLVDNDKDAMTPLRRLTPEVGFPETQDGSQVYGTAWPLSENYYLCVYDASVSPLEGQQGGVYIRGKYGIYLLDSFGNKELIYRDSGIACQSPIPVRPQPVPPVAPDGVSSLAGDKIERRPGTRQALSVDGKPAEGTMAVINCYDSLMPWPEGTKIKALRVIQVLPMSVPSASPQIKPGPGIGFVSVALCRQVLGTVPVEEDGSAHFVVPAHKEIYFQALDERGLAVQTMRSGTYLQPGERLTCQGCHERKEQTPKAPAAVPLALRRGPSRLVPDVDGTNPFSYPRLVQPVLDKHCVECHAKPESKAPSMAREPIGQYQWYASYGNLLGNAPPGKYAFHDGYDNLWRTTPGKFGARASKLFAMLEKGHHDVKLSPEELHRLTVWMDCCSIFYGVYEGEGGRKQSQGEIVRPTLE